MVTIFAITFPSIFEVVYDCRTVFEFWVFCNRRDTKCVWVGAQDEYDVEDSAGAVARGWRANAVQRLVRQAGPIHLLQLFYYTRL